jgi:hypothetical protein
MVNSDYLTDGIVSLLFSLAMFVYSSRWVEGKKQRKELSNYDRTSIIFRDWLIIITFGLLGIFYLAQFFFT